MSSKYKAKPRAGNAEKDRRRREGVERNEAWAKLAPAQQLSILDTFLGKGKGAVKQRTRIAARVAKEKKS